jgi:carbon storage regulator
MIRKMLVLSRKEGQAIHIGSDIVITVAKLGGNRVRIAVDAPKHVPVLRGELAEWQEGSFDDVELGDGQGLADNGLPHCPQAA